MIRTHSPHRGWAAAAAFVVLAGGFGLGYAARQDTPPAPLQTSANLKAKSDPATDEARKSIQDAFNARIQGVLACLPKDATPLARMQALRPLWDEERQWHLFFEGTLYTNELRSNWKGVGPVAIEHPTQFLSLDAKFIDAIKAPERIDQHYIDTVLTELPKVHLLRREFAREILTKVVRTVSTDQAGLAEIWPVAPDTGSAAPK